jgi:hypothetical protein
MFARINATSWSRLLLEIAMIVVGINIALWFESWFEDLQDSETEQQYLQGLRDDLRTDISMLDQIIESNSRKIERLESTMPGLRGLVERSAEDQAAVIFMPSSYQFFQPADFTYRSMQESGDFRLLSDEGVKKGLLRQIRTYRLIEELQRNFLQAMDAEYIPLMMKKFDLAEGRVTDPSLVENQVFLNFFAFTLDDTNGRNTQNHKAAEQARQLLDKILLQLGEETPRP